MSFNIAIDGPAGAGKSTIARRIAKELGYVYVDTGAMYRAMGLYLDRKNIPFDNVELISFVCNGADITLSYKDGEQIVWLNGENVNGLIRTEEVGNAASKTSVHPPVRKRLIALQKKLAETANVVMDGRDIGTVVLPNADAKIFLTASVEVRAKRRYDELMAKGTPDTMEHLVEIIRERDLRDTTREESPLKQAEDAVLVDTSDMSIDEVCARILEICSGKGLC